LQRKRKHTVCEAILAHCVGGEKVERLEEFGAVVRSIVDDLLWVADADG
jgi:hypothetical protein